MITLWLFSLFFFFVKVGKGKYENCFKDTVTWVQGTIYSKCDVKAIMFLLLWFQN